MARVRVAVAAAEDGAGSSQPDAGTRLGTVAPAAPTGSGGWPVQGPWWHFFGQVTVTSVVYTWLVNHSTSVVPALILHTSFNTSVGLLPVMPTSADSAAPAVIALGVATVIAAALLISTGGRLGAARGGSRPHLPGP